MVSAAACEAMCRPSASNAIDENRMPATTSTIIMVAVIAITSWVLRSPGRLESWPNAWSCCQGSSESCCMICSSGGARTRASVHAQNQAFEIIGLGEFSRDGMVRRLRQAFENLRRAARINRGARDDFLEQRCVDVPGTGERRERAAGTHELKTKHVDVFV